MKDLILRRLRNEAPGFVSGEALSEALGVSRTAVWKYMNELKDEGYVIESTSKKGYRFVSAPDILTPGEISYQLETEVIGKNIYSFDVIDSTNNYAKKIAMEGCEDGSVVVAETQTSGKGRLGRAWNAAKKAGIWMSVVLRPSIPPEDVQVITIAASVAVVSALKRTTGISAGIKWPNDIVVEGKKVCGILTEMNSEMEQVNFLVLGIGINVNQETEDFPEDLRNTAISLKGAANENKIPVEMFKRSDIIRSILFELEQSYKKINSRNTGGIIDEWRKYSVTLGKEVKVSAKSFEYKGIAQDITEDGKLVVKCDDGTVREIMSGEISVRGILGYV